MIKKILLILPILVGSCTTPSTADTCGEFNKQLDKTYNFKPSKLTSKQIEKKSDEMDLIWAKVKADRNLESCLLEALNVRKEDRFFRFDASNLLIQLNASDENKKLLIQTYGEVDLADVNLRDWISFVVRYGYDGLDTSAAGDNWLRFPDPKYYLEQHDTLEVDKEAGALIIFGSMDESFATPALVKIASNKEHPGREIAVDLLTLQVTSESIMALAKMDQTGLSEKSKQKVRTFLTNPILIEKRQGEPKVSRDEYLSAFKEMTEGGGSSRFMQLVSRVPDGEKDAIAVLKTEDVSLVRKARRFWASTGTPHAPAWYKSFTDILMAMVWKSEIGKAKEQIKP